MKLKMDGPTATMAVLPQLQVARSLCVSFVRIGCDGCSRQVSGSGVDPRKDEEESGLRKGHLFTVLTQPQNREPGRIIYIATDRGRRQFSTDRGTDA